MLLGAQQVPPNRGQEVLGMRSRRFSPHAVDDVQGEGGGMERRVLRNGTGGCRGRTGRVRCVPSSCPSAESARRKAGAGRARALCRTANSRVWLVGGHVSFCLRKMDPSERRWKHPRVTLYLPQAQRSAGPPCSKSTRKPGLEHGGLKYDHRPPVGRAPHALEPLQAAGRERTSKLEI